MGYISKIENTNDIYYYDKDGNLYWELNVMEKIQRFVLVINVKNIILGIKYQTFC